MKILSGPTEEFNSESLQHIATGSWHRRFRPLLCRIWVGVRNDASAQKAIPPGAGPGQHRHVT